MQLSLRSNHAMRLIMYCAISPRPIVPISEIAVSCKISEAHLAKIAHFLAKRGFIETIRGRSGGVRLSKAPELLNIGEIVRATELCDSFTECMNEKNNTCPLINICRFRTILGRGLEAFFGVLDGYTVDDIIRERESMLKAFGFCSD